MKRGSFSLEKCLAKLKDQLRSSNLSLSTIDRIEKKILYNLGGEPIGVIKKLLDIIEQKRDEIVKTQVRQLNSIRNLFSRMNKLKYLFNFLCSQEIDACFDRIEQEAAFLADPDREAVQKELQHLRFRQICPILYELDDSPNHFYYRMREISKNIQKDDSLKPLKQLNTRQLQEILHSAGQSQAYVSPEGIEYAIDQYIALLQRQALVAEWFYYGHIGKGVDGLKELPEEICSRIEELLEDAFPGQIIDFTDPAYCEFIAKAIVYALGEQMGFCA